MAQARPIVLGCVLFVATVLLGLTSCTRQEEGLGPGRFAPNLEVMSLDGKETTLRESLDGQVVLVNFWTSWCQPCKVEMPDLQELHDTFAARGDMPRQFSVIGVAVDDNLPAIQKFIAETGISFPVYYDKGGLSTTRYALAGFPESVFLDADGRVLMVMDPQSGEPVTKIIGPRSWAAAASVRLVQSLIERVM